MADNVDITAGTGTTVATDAVGSVHYQRVKLTDGTADSSTAISAGPGVESTALRVTVATDSAAVASLQIIDDLTLAQGATTSGQKGSLTLGAVTTAAPTYTTGQSSAISLDPAGALRVAITSGAGSGGTSIADDAPFLVASTSLGPVGGVYRATQDAVDDGDAGAFAMTQKRAIHATHVTPLNDSMVDDTLDALKVTIVGDTVGSAVDTEDGSVAAAQTSIALVIGMPYMFDGTGWVRGGYTPYKLNCASSTNLTSVKAAAGVLGMCVVTNTNAAVRYLKLYNKASAPVLASDTPVMVVAIPGATTGGGVAVPIPERGIAFALGIAFAITTGAADTNTGAVTADEIIVNLGYK